ncbi:hypothetical protein E4K67_15230 [Desulfosporosinus fructosivorans]|uniref:Uncharacterized protein n=1 Tax=Desulfosporosinus fructosivorans TaxID=2018669 RepID=A0A4Z0R428_9FIRM|nr:hypothetical protein [Desulfosporosinus fructosivorans]TGE37219.1 hypothetical protein E4K67_15230 [Desulfosporosinus fructosivorans]
MNINNVKPFIINPFELKAISATEKLVIKDTLDDRSGTTEVSGSRKAFELILDSSHWQDLSPLTQLEGLSADECAQIHIAFSEAISSGLQSYDDTTGRRY